MIKSLQAGLNFETKVGETRFQSQQLRRRLDNCETILETVALGKVHMMIGVHVVDARC